MNIPSTMFYPLFSLQHRGQESAGIAYEKNGNLVVYKDLGMVSTVLSRYLHMERSSKVGIGHVRYSTHGGNKIENAQPILVNSNKGQIAIAHNGNISNTEDLKAELFSEGSIFQTTSDTEIILHLLSRSRKTDFVEALVESLSRLKGAFSIVMIHENRLIALRDPYGFRPLYLGTKDDLTVVASETCALDILKMENIRSIEPGELVIISDEGMRSVFLPKAPAIRQCVFELIYFARPDSCVFDIPVHTTRKKMGAALARADMAAGDLHADIVVPVPDSGNSAALGYAEASGIPYEAGLTRNHYSGRSFIMPSTEKRRLAVRVKLHPIRDAIQGKRVLLVDDSLVRGTTSQALVELMREGGAKEVHLRLCSPEIRWPCFFGIDIPTRNELISNFKTPPEIASYIGADSVRFLPIQALRDCLPNPDHFCYSCFRGIYPFEVPFPGCQIEGD